MKRVDRIILYVGDLDRCPAEQVVRVLEAIHMLLAFPLFVVVVGIDLRWLVNCLHRYYTDEMLSRGREPARSLGAERSELAGEDADIIEPVERLSEMLNAQHQPTPLDYVEKIFQIPFWLPPFDPNSGRNLLALLLEDDEIATDSTAGGVERSGAGQPNPAQTHDQDEPAQPDRPAAEQEERGARVAAAQAQHQLADDRRAELIMRPMTFADLKKKGVMRFSAFVGGSPRRAKRFVNTYRIIKAGCSHEEEDKFVLEEGGSGSYLAVLALLSISIGAPKGARRVLSAITRHRNIDDIVSDVLSYQPQVEAEDVLICRDALRLFDELSTSPNDMDDLRRWRARVVQFSFGSQ